MPRYKGMKSWLKQNRIPLLEPWPGNSPDLNAIENVWTVLKQKVSRHKYFWGTINQLNKGGLGERNNTRVLQKTGPVDATADTNCP